MQHPGSGIGGDRASRGLLIVDCRWEIENHVFAGAFCNQQSRIINLQSCLNPGGQGAEVGDSLQLIIGELDLKMVLEPRKQIQCLQAVDAKRLEEIVVGREFLPWHLEMGRGKAEDFLKSLVSSRHTFLLCSLLIIKWLEASHGKYGCASVLSTNLRRPASTEGRLNSSQKISISRRNSSYGIGLMNCLAAIAV